VFGVDLDSEQPAKPEKVSEAANEQPPAAIEKPEAQAEATDGTAAPELPAQSAEAAASPFDPANDPAVPAETALPQCRQVGAFARIVVCPK